MKYIIVTLEPTGLERSGSLNYENSTFILRMYTCTVNGV